MLGILQEFLVLQEFFTEFLHRFFLVFPSVTSPEIPIRILLVSPAWIRRGKSGIDIPVTPKTFS